MNKNELLKKLNKELFDDIQMLDNTENTLLYYEDSLKFLYKTPMTEPELCKAGQRVKVLMPSYWIGASNTDEPNVWIDGEITSVLVSTDKSLENEYNIPSMLIKLYPSKKYNTVGIPNMLVAPRQIIKDNSLRFVVDNTDSEFHSTMILNNWDNAVGKKIQLRVSGAFLCVDDDSVWLDGEIIKVNWGVNEIFKKKYGIPAVTSLVYASEKYDTNLMKMTILPDMIIRSEIIKFIE